MRRTLAKILPALPEEQLCSEAAPRTSFKYVLDTRQNSVKIQNMDELIELLHNPVVLGLIATAAIVLFYVLFMRDPNLR